MNHHDLPNAYLRYVPPDEGPDVASAWKAASEALDAAASASENYLDAEARKYMAEVYAQLGKLRSLGAIEGLRKHRHAGYFGSKLIRYGEHHSGTDSTQDAAAG